MAISESLRVLVTGGAGFVGSNLAIFLKTEFPQARIVAFDNLKRRGSELILSRLRDAGIGFVHGDVRIMDDLAPAGEFDLLLECSAEPSVHAGYGESPRYLLDTNLYGTINCLEACRQHNAAMVFLSTSRVYPIENLRNLPLIRQGDRLTIEPGKGGAGWSQAGIAADFPLTGPRSLYGTTKFASELLIAEYIAMYGLKAVINRCGVISGPWQMGKVDQGFCVLWAARHIYGGKLAYMGFGGEGVQVRDVLHVFDLYRLIKIQLENMERLSGRTYNVGGGNAHSTSLRELTALCAKVTGKKLDIGSDPGTRGADIPYYITDNDVVTAETGWRPERSMPEIVDDIVRWLTDNKSMLESVMKA